MIMFLSRIFKAAPAWLFFGTDKCKKLIDSCFTMKIGGLAAVALPYYIVKNEALNNSNKELNNYTSHGMDHQKIISDSCVNSFQSSDQMLTRLLLAIIDAASIYKISLDNLMDFVQSGIESIEFGKIDEKLDDFVITSRHEMQQCKKAYMELITLIPYVEKLAIATAELAFLAGAETLSILLSEKLYSIKEKICAEQDAVQKLENKYLILEAELIHKFGKPAEDEKDDCKETENSQRN